jgi:hypothetical protein
MSVLLVSTCCYVCCYRRWPHTLYGGRGCINLFRDHAYRTLSSVFSSLWTNPLFETQYLPHNSNVNVTDYCLVHNYVHVLISGPPPKPSDFCFLTNSVGGNMSITIYWNSSFNSQYNVERYQVAVTPDPASRCTGSVSPNTSYTCSGLSLHTDYTITVSAINCGDQEGESVNISVPRSLGTLLVASHA